MPAQISQCRYLLGRGAWDEYGRRARQNIRMQTQRMQNEPDAPRNTKAPDANEQGSFPNQISDSTNQQELLPSFLPEML